MKQNIKKQVLQELHNSNFPNLELLFSSEALKLAKL